ncbi:sensor histidine kinase [Anianabacter salinae]|uniref:sensor histidine kinase n=1 Tax=Anianabacter salinae TaxID=2851023 RepID=UPI002B21A869|nr:ATP-binding protein [Anianabacter salinae]
MSAFSRRSARVAGFLIAAALFAAGVWWFAFTAALDQLEERGRADLALASDRVSGQLQRFRELAVLLSDHPALVPLVTTGEGDLDVARATLTETADKTGSLRIRLIDHSGRILVATDRAAGGTVAGRPDFERAMDGGLGSDHRVDPDTGRRLYTFASPVFGPGGPVEGVVTVTLDTVGLEWNWPADPSTVYFSDDLGVVFVSNRSDLILTVRDPDRRDAARSTLYSGIGLAPFPDFSAALVSGHDLWSVDGGRYLPRRALHLTQPLPVIGLTGEILLDLTPAINLANLQALVAAALCLAFGALLYLATERRRVLAEQLAAEAALNAELEARVAERTQALSEANTDLRREVGERIEAETALKKAQADLVQAGKLSALGQMSAGISHELNQPLMAIRSFAENAGMLIDRGKPEVARDNLARISELARRMGRIIKNLRAFARQEVAEVADVDLGEVVDAALEIMMPKVEQAGARVDWVRPGGAVMVRGGEVRLQQVVMNLVSNAVDAMEGTGGRRIAIHIEEQAARTCLFVRDSGPGIADPDRIFDPFYSTKEVGHAEGMGLGLSISYGLVQSFGGAIRGRNRPEGGAEFVVELDRAALERAA